MTASAAPISAALPSPSRRAREALSALEVLVRDPSRLDQVLVLTQAVNLGKLSRLVDQIARSPEGARLLADKPRIDRVHVDYDELRELPTGTLGREYARFLDDNRITPDAFADLPSVGDERMAWVMLRMRQTHDLWHVLTGYAPDVPGEIRLQAFLYAQTRAPSALLLTIFGTMRWALSVKGHLPEVVRAYRRGKATRPLATFRWEEHWATPVSELRQRLACPA